MKHVSCGLLSCCACDAVQHTASSACPGCSLETHMPQWFQPPASRRLQQTSWNTCLMSLPLSCAVTCTHMLHACQPTLGAAHKRLQLLCNQPACVFHQVVSCNRQQRTHMAWRSVGPFELCWSATSQQHAAFFSILHQGNNMLLLSLDSCISSP
jgi:hypothetical protein